MKTEVITYRTPSTLKSRYDQYRYLFNDGNGNDERTGQPLMTFEEWLENS
jgi:hypothetical protein